MWKVLTEEERADLLGSVIQLVEMTEKKSVTKKEHGTQTVASYHAALSFVLSEVCVKLSNGSGSPRCCELPVYPVS